MPDIDPWIWIAAHGGRRKVAQKLATPPAVLECLSHDRDPWIRRLIASNPATPESIVCTLSNDTHDWVKSEAHRQLRARRAAARETPANKGTVDGPKKRRKMRPIHAALRKGGRRMRFAQLPEEAQMALVRYMDEPAPDWNYSEFHKDPIGYVRDRLPYFRKRYAGMKVGYTPAIPTRLLIDSVMQDTDIDHETWEEYHDWYVTHGDMPEHDVSKPLWPVILADHTPRPGSDYVETLQDGWHRLHHYVRSGVTHIPAIYFDFPA